MPANASPLDLDAENDTLRSVGARLTAPRQRVLHVLRAAQTPLTHRDVVDRVSAEGGATIDRVTIYRVLDWLVSVGLASKASDAQRVFRFAVSVPDVRHERHVHFRCTGCGGVYCLKDAPPPVPRLPRGFRLTGMHIDIQGECARCAADALQ